LPDLQLSYGWASQPHARAVPPKRREEGVSPDRCEGGPPLIPHKDGRFRGAPCSSWPSRSAPSEQVLCKRCARLATRGPVGCSGGNAGV